MTIQAYLLMQRCSDSELLEIRKDVPDFFNISNIEGRVSLSKARNIILSSIDGGDLSGSVVAFPDDDCWYPHENLDAIIEEFSSSPELDLFYCRYSSSPAALPKRFKRQLSPGVFSVVSYASSNTMIMRGDLVRQAGLFDETLGVGAKYNGGEDTDFALRIVALSKNVIFADGAHIGHRNPDKTLRGVYYPGALLAIANSARIVSGGWRVLAKKIAVGFWLVLKRELPLKKYLDVLGLGFRRFIAK
ncbi:MAG: hypothetical protein WAV95_08085 [Azonexus sp.]